MSLPKGSEEEKKEEESKIKQLYQRGRDSTVNFAETAAVVCSKKRNQIKQRFKMEGLLADARKSFEMFLKKKKDATEFEDFMTDHVWSTARAVVFISEWRAGLSFMGGKGCAGVMFVRIDDGDESDQMTRWSAPIALKGGGVSFGFELGASKVNHIIVLTSENQVKSFVHGDYRLQISGNVEAVAFNVGRDVEVGVGFSSREGDPDLMATYSMNCKGLYIGVSFRGAMLTVDKKTMSSFYRGNVEEKDIFSGRVAVLSENEDYNRIIQSLVIMRNDDAVNNKKQAIKTRPECRDEKKEDGGIKAGDEIQKDDDNKDVGDDSKEDHGIGKEEDEGNDEDAETEFPSSDEDSGDERTVSDPLDGN